MTEPLLLTDHRGGGIARVRLNRPAVRNAFNADLIEALNAAFAALGTDDRVRAVVLEGSGKSFCGGADVNWMRASLDLSAQENVRDAERMSEMYRAIDTCPKPVIGRIHGAALGGGSGLAAVCDIVVAADDAIFGFTETKLGIIPAVISPFVLAKIGVSNARALFFTGERFDAQRAREIGLVHAVVPASELDARVEAVEIELATSGPTAIGAIKRLIAQVTEAGYVETKGLTAQAIAVQRTSPEGQEGLRAFLERCGLGREVVRRLLIANRGEIAVRIARGARDLGISPVGVYSDADEHALFRSVMDASVRIGPAPAAESYLRSERILAAARELDADAVHPGYGFLSERAHFAQAVIDAGLIFVGPTPSAIAAMGSKIDAKRRVREHGVPVIPGYDGDDQSPERLRREAAAIGTPVLVKASAGGGGRGMRLVEDLAAFDDALAAAKREAQAAFGDDSVLLERYLRRPRHIEFQILADSWGTTLYLGERECSIQRRHQKVFEEAPSVALDPALRAMMGEAAVTAARSVAYENAGTAEFMLDEDGQFYFLEMNARLQVEHPVTEIVYGIDIVQQQLRIARGEQLRFTQGDLVPRGWAIEARLNAEDPARDFLPSTGTIGRFEVPSAAGVRVDTGVRDGSEISIYYDSLIAKIIVSGSDRAAAIARMESTLRDTRVTGVKTNLPLLRAVVRDESYRSGDITTRFLDDRDAYLHVKFLAAAALVASGRAWRMAGVGVPVDLTIDGMPLRTTLERRGTAWAAGGELQAGFTAETRGNDVIVMTGARTIVGDVRLDAQGGRILHNGRAYGFTFAPPPDADPRRHGAAEGAAGAVRAPMPGKIVSINVAGGDVVDARALLVVLEAMKMEHRIEAPLAGTVESVHVKLGDIVSADAELVTLRA